MLPSNFTHYVVETNTMSDHDNGDDDGLPMSEQDMDALIQGIKEALSGPLTRSLRIEMSAAAVLSVWDPTRTAAPGRLTPYEHIDMMSPLQPPPADMMHKADPIADRALYVIQALGGGLDGPEDTQRFSVIVSSPFGMMHTITSMHAILVALHNNGDTDITSEEVYDAFQGCKLASRLLTARYPTNNSIRVLRATDTRHRSMEIRLVAFPDEGQFGTFDPEKTLDEQAVVLSESVFDGVEAISVAMKTYNIHADTQDSGRLPTAGKRTLH